MMTTLALATVFALMGSTAVSAPPAQADVNPGFSIGTTALYRPSGSGSRYIYVDATRGSDFAYDPTGHESGDAPWPRQDCLHGNRTPYWARTNGQGSANCPQPDAAHPMRSIKVAIYASRPGDVIVVRGGTYNEAVSTTGDGRTDHRGTSSTRRLVLQNYPGESVKFNGYINFQDPDYWTIAGIRFGWHPTITGNNNYIVGMFGGTGWVFHHNEVSGSHGNSNMLVSFKSGGFSAATAPQSWYVSQNCIHNNRANNPGSIDHNLYVKASQYSRGGVIQRNFMWNAPNGANIKLGPSQNPAESPAYVTVRNNTLLRAGTGVVVGSSSHHISITRNVIGLPYTPNRDDGGIKTYSMRYPTTVSVDNNYVAGWPSYIRETGSNSYGHVRRSNNKVWDQRTTGSYNSCTLVPATSSVRNGWGHVAN
ncbi:hypothetical protein [Microbacterium sp. MM2322]|uniref:hypothetical protein n=1 Tax=Microbacterium sp. MM2322 TaxID=3157631 RepID=UPI0032D59FBE